MHLIRFKYQKPYEELLIRLTHIRPKRLHLRP